MSQFERIYQSDPSRESDHKREMHPSIELSDADYYATLQPKVSKDMEKEGWVYREPCKVDENSPEVLKQKQAFAELLCKKTKVITLNNEPPPIPMNLDMPILEKEIRKGDKNAKSKSKSTKARAKKANPKSNKPAMASI